MNYFDLEKKYLFQTYKRTPLLFVKGTGKYLYDNLGNKYLDMFSGISVSSVGYCNPRIVKTIKRQLDILIHLSNLFYSKTQIELAEMFSDVSFGDKVFFSNSGAEANECAIKLARKYGHGRYEIIVFNNSFHGRTIATLSATGQKKFHEGFAPLLKGFKFAVFNDISSVKKLLNKRTCAILIEPVQGESGIYPADKTFLKELRALCDKNDLLLIFDEIQCGLGRTGRLFAYESYGVVPDIMTLAKSLGGGLPIGATIAKEKAASCFKYGDHGSTFGGNPICCAAAIEVLKILRDKKLLKHIADTGKYFINRLTMLKEKHTVIKEIRGMGFMIGVELNVKGSEIVSKCFEKGLLINCTKEKTLRFLPPFIICKSDIDRTINILDNALKSTAGGQKGG